MQIVTIQTVTGKEKVLQQYLDTLVGTRLATEVFIPKREILRRFHGTWVKKEELLIPGYLFVDTADGMELYHELRKIPMFSKLLGDEEARYVTLTPQEEAFIRKIGISRGDHTFGISQVMIESDQPFKKGDHVAIISGDLQDFEGEIIGFNFHKRKAMVRSALLGSSVIHVGIEILEKCDDYK